MLDVDHDGDLDVLAGGSAVPGSPLTLQLLRNNGEGALTDITAAAKLPSTRHITGAGADRLRQPPRHRRAGLADGRAPSLFQNQRDGTFRDVSPNVGLGSWTGGVAVAAGDLNKDGYTDFFVAKGPARAEVAFSDGRGRFTVSPGPKARRD